MTETDEERLRLEQEALEEGNGWLAGGPMSPFSALSSVTHVAVEVGRLEELKAAEAKLAEYSKPQRYLTPQERKLFWAVYDAIMVEARNQKMFICCGFSIDDKVLAVVDAALDCEMHGSTWRRCGDRSNDD